MALLYCLLYLQRVETRPLVSGYNSSANQRTATQDLPTQSVAGP